MIPVSPFAIERSWLAIINRVVLPEEKEKGISYFSSTSLSEARLSRASRPLYRAGGHYPLGPIAEEKGLTGEPVGAKVFAGAFVRRHGLGSASNVQRAVDGLLEKDIIDRDNGSFLITDRFFRLWIQAAQAV